MSKVFNKKIPFFRAPVDKEQEVQRTLKAETRCMFYTIQTIFRLARPAVLSVLRLTVTFFIIYSLSRNNEHPPLRHALQPVKSHTFDVQILTTLLTFLFLTGSSKAEGILDSFTSEVCRFACKTALRCKWRITLNFSTISPVDMLPKFNPSL